MSPEQLTAMIQALGYPICVSIALFFSLRTVFGLYVRMVEKYFGAVTELTQATRAHADRMEELSKHSNEALSANTTSNRRLVEAIESRPPTICRAELLLRGEGRGARGDGDGA